MNAKILSLFSCIIIFSILLKLYEDFEVFVVVHLNELLFNELLFRYITEIGNAVFLIAIVVPVLSLLSYSSNHFKYVPLRIFLIPGIFLGMFVQLIKEVLNFPRPATNERLLSDESIIFLEPIFFQGAYPSGHTASIFFVFYVFYRFGKKISDCYSNVVFFSLFVLASVVAVSRIILGAHWLSDVIGAAGISMLFVEFLKHKTIQKFLRGNIYINFFSILLVGLAFYALFFLEAFDYL